MRLQELLIESHFSESEVQNVLEGFCTRRVAVTVISSRPWAKLGATGNANSPINPAEATSGASIRKFFMLIPSF